MYAFIFHNYTLEDKGMYVIFNASMYLCMYDVHICIRNGGHTQIHCRHATTLIMTAVAMLIAFLFCVDFLHHHRHHKVTSMKPINVSFLFLRK